MNSKKYLARVALSMALAASTAFTMAPIANAAELSQAKSTAEIHYGTVSKSDQELLAGMFDAEFYKKTNPDVVAAVGEDPTALFNHFITCGVFEGRSANKAFNVNVYASAYGDLKAAFGNDIIAYYRHYVAYGQQEQRTITTFAAAAAAGITVVSLADSTVVIPPAVIYAAERLGTTDLETAQKNAASGGGSSSSSSSSSSSKSSTSKDDTSKSDTPVSEEKEAIVKLSATSLTFKVDGAAQKLTATYEGFTPKTTSWKSDKETVATVDASGNVTPKAEGTATITLTATDGTVTKTATCAVTVSKDIIAVTGITLEPTTATIVAGKTVDLVAEVAPSNATNKVVNWFSNNETVATVEDGVVTGVGSGEATITAITEDGAKATTCVVTVEPAPVVTVEDLEIPITTESALLDFDHDHFKGNDDDIEYSFVSADEDVATVDDLGVVSPVGVGRTTITVTATCGDEIATANCIVDVTNYLTNIALALADGASDTIDVDGTTALEATLTPEDAVDSIVWTSSDPTVASVPEDIDGAECTVTGLKPGTATITATSAGNEGVTGSKVVTVSGVVIDDGEHTVVVDGTIDLSAAHHEYGAAAGEDVVWTSSDSTIASVENGIVTGVKAGAATITATVNASGTAYTATYSVTVPNYLTSVDLALKSGQSPVINPQGTTVLTATVAPETAEDTITWTSDKPEIASVPEDSTGEEVTVTGNKPGKANITVTSDSNEEVNDEFEITVSGVVIKDEDHPDEPCHEVEVEGGLNLGADQYGFAEGETPVWVSSNTEVATVTPEGVVTGVAEGDATITATVTNYGTEYTDSYDVTVVEAQSDPGQGGEDPQNP